MTPRKRGPNRQGRCSQCRQLRDVHGSCDCTGPYRSLSRPDSAADPYRAQRMATLAARAAAGLPLFPLLATDID
jgi:hypothetical protein